MSKKKIKGVMYSTNKNWTPDYESDEEDTLPPSEQVLRVRLETKQRGGKKATIVSGFVGTEEDRKELGKKLKTKLGVGGSIKESEILIQGDYKQKVIEILKTLGYSNSK